MEWSQNRFKFMQNQNMYQLVSSDKFKNGCVNKIEWLLAVEYRIAQEASTSDYVVF